MPNHIKNRYINPLSNGVSAGVARARDESDTV
jgi:hypothetical protein